MLGALRAGLLHRLINDQTLPSIMCQMPLNDWKQWAKERPVCVCGVVEDAFWAFMDQKWKDSLNVAAAEPAGWDQGANYWRGLEGAKKGEGERQVATKGPLAGVHVAVVGDSQAVPGRTPRSVKFTELAGCTGSHPYGCAKLLGTRPLKRGTKSLWTTSACCTARMRCASPGRTKRSQSVQSQGAESSTSSGCMKY